MVARRLTSRPRDPGLNSVQTSNQGIKIIEVNELLIHTSIVVSSTITSLSRPQPDGPNRSFSMI